MPLPAIAAAAATIGGKAAGVTGIAKSLSFGGKSGFLSGVGNAFGSATEGIGNIFQEKTSQHAQAPS